MNATSPIGHAAPPELTGQHAPEWACEQTGHEDCPRCGARPGCDCTCGPGFMHLSRYVRCCKAGHISDADVAYFIPDGDDFTGATVVPNPGSAA